MSLKNDEFLSENLESDFIISWNREIGFLFYNNNSEIIMFCENIALKYGQNSASNSGPLKTIN